MTIKKLKGFDEREKKLHRVDKVRNHVDKHRKSIYNIVSELQDEDMFENDLDEVELQDTTQAY